MDNQKREPLTVRFSSLFFENVRYLRKKIFKPYVRWFCIRCIRFYQKHLSKKTCLYYPTCSQYTMECFHHHGVTLGFLMGAWRILRCNPFSKGGYDPAPLPYFKKKWLL